MPEPAGAAAPAGLHGDRLEQFLADLAGARDAHAGAQCLTDVFADATESDAVLLYRLDERERTLQLDAATGSAGDAPRRLDRDAASAGHALFATALSLCAMTGDALFDGAPDASWALLPLPQPRLSFSSALLDVPAARAAAGERWTVLTPAHGERRGRVGLAPLGVVAIRLARGADPCVVIDGLRGAATLAGPILSRGLAVEQYRAMAARADLERDQLDRIFDYVADPIVVTDAAGAIVEANQQAERLLRAPDGEGERDPERDARRATNLAAFVAFARDVTGAPTRRGRLTLVNPANGNPLPIEVVTGTIAGRRDEPAVMVSVLHDLTTQSENERLYEELKRFSAVLETRVRGATADLESRNAQLQVQSEELERANRLKSEFLATMSHELRTPINALIGYTALLRDRVYGELTPKQDDGLRRIHGSAEQLLALVTDILDLARIDAGRMPVHLERVALAPIVRDATTSHESAARTKGLAFAVELPSEPLYVRSDASRLRQVIGNLVGNAVKFTAEGRVTVRAAREGDSVRVDVVDTGIGIRAEDVATIWQDFRQLDQSRTRAYGGTGLGLTIVRKLAERLEATVTVESALGAGSTFTVRVPAAPLDP